MQATFENTVHEALRYLAGRCDYAATLDGAGFNGLDAAFGHSLADQGRLTEKQYAAAYRMLRKYRRQLAAGGFDYDKFEAPDQRRAPAPAGSDRRVDVEGDVFVISFPYDREIVSAMQAVPDRRWVGSRKVNTVPVERCLEVEAFAAAHGFTVSAAAREAMDEQRAVAEAEAARVAAIVAASKAQDADIDLPVKGLRPFQKAGVAYALNARRTFIGDEMGLGKSVQALVTVETADAFPVLIVAPKAVVGSWRMEAARWLPARRAVVVSTKTQRLDESAEIIITNYESVVKLRGALEGNVASLIVDESHFVKNRGTATKPVARTEAIKAIAASLTDPDPVILLLSGTAMKNGRPAELITQLEILRRLDALGGFWKFWNRYCGKSQTGAYNLNELNVRLRENCFVRRLKAEVLTELPAKVWTTVPVPVSNAREYRRVEADFLAWVREQGGDVASAARAETLTRINALRKTVAESKQAASIEWIRNFLDSDGKLVVFAHHRDQQDAVLAALSDYNPRAIYGGQSTEERDRFIAEFQADDSVRVIVCSLMAAGMGITLTAASNVALLEHGWTPADEDQAADRCHRIGQTDSVTVWTLSADLPDSIDEHMAAMVSEKRSLNAQAMDGTAAAEQSTAVLGELVRRMTA